MDTPGQDPGLTHAQEAAPVATVFVSDQDSEGVIRQSLSDLGIDDAEFKKGTVETATAYLATQPSPRLLFVDLSGVDDPVVHIYELADRCEPSVSVVVIGDRNDIILYRDLKNAGVSEYFFKPLIIDAVKATCNRILNDGREHSPSQRTGKLVFVIGVRGGVGATTIAANAAWYLAEKKQRWVMLVDLDLHNGDAALQFDSTPGHALSEAFEKPERVDRLFLERGTIHVRERLDLLASLEPLSESTTLAEGAVLSLLGKLLHRYRFVFVDLPSIVALGLAQVLHQPSVCVLVSDASLASARELSRWREWIGPNSAERRTLHVLNMNGADGALPQAEFIRAVGQAPDIIIPYDRDIAIASKFGVKATRKCAVLNRGLARLLRDFTGETDGPTRSIFSRIFG
ncbi:MULTISPECIES: CpaE family protein [Bradyrhizobium]|jgi:pilus assembly protein CpaE|uniref:Response regulator receiver protein n=2 Tax=Bradyrhizobium TaxID=374 RepID=A0ABS5GGB7_9BRAD|nr:MULTISPECIES: cellulose synthase operon protein YhjQ/BcsQ [Bradyrhizobium]RTM03006.1 MAG: response regulator receiver protein [Bradyrhizobiaceae bacterium]MBR1140388.1 response regulator receiver protein [Bradyrhizobium denitrificans]MCL8487967.1 response regulator receiver protein [Bradyrhizobium denitrificans]MDU1497065.1 cellulose synthase operon protein YhjQ/BcsQ [Bradyrhizobium sp.]MDU1547202.1 cellulose synthase operon protein YhjQ/BcsQ [Bradyrhizobium sp.]